MQSDECAIQCVMRNELRGYNSLGIWSVSVRGSESPRYYITMRNELRGYKALGIWAELMRGTFSMHPHTNLRN